MILPAPAVLATPAPSQSPFSLDGAFLLARAAARGAADPRTVLAADGATLEEKLAAIDAIHSRLPIQNPAGRRAAIDALAAAAVDANQPPEVRAKALTHLGYSLPLADDDRTRVKGVETLLAALQSPTYRIYGLRGLGPASYGLPATHEAVYLAAILDLLDTPVAGEERATAMVALFSFVSFRDDLPKRKPALLAQLDARLLAPIESAPQAFVLDPRGSDASRQMAVAVLWSAARQRERHGDHAAVARTRTLFAQLSRLETSPSVRAWINLYRGANPAQPFRQNGAEDDAALPGPLLVAG